MKKNITKEEEKALLEIAKRLMAAVDSRGDLEARDNDSEDFIEVPLGHPESNGRSLPAGTDDQINRQPPTQPHTGACATGGKTIRMNRQRPTQGQMWRRGCARRRSTWKSG